MSARLIEAAERVCLAFEGTTKAADDGSSVRYVRLINAVARLKETLAEAGPAPSEEPRPNEPGWWIRVRGGKIRLEDVRDDPEGDGLVLWYEDHCGNSESAPIPSGTMWRWYGPIALPWEKS